MSSDDALRSGAPPRPLASLFACLLLVYAAEAIGAIASIDAVAFYARLAQPSWAPPSWVFGPVWTLLYTLMAVSLWRIWHAPRSSSAPIILFVVQLGVNAAWSWLFFRWHLGAVAFGGIVLLLALIGVTMTAFWRVSRAAALLLLPYLGWVAFATALCFAVWRANPAVLG